MRILLLDSNVRFVNDTRNLLPSLLQASGELVTFGPGYVSTQELEQGLHAFLDQRDAVDIIVITEHMLYAGMHGAELISKTININYSCKFPLTDLKYVTDIAKDAKALGVPIVVSLVETDFYNIQKKNLDMIESYSEAVLAPSSQFILPMANLPNLSKEYFSIHANDHWHDYAVKNAGRIGSFPCHYVASGEFYYNDLTNRYISWSVPGVNYYSRELSSSMLRKANLLPFEMPWHLMPSLLNKLGLKPYGKDWVQRVMQYKFRKTLSESKYAFTCGSGSSVPVRKFFEIPAAGAVLTCIPFSGFRDAGYIDQVNAIVCDPKDILEVHKWLESDLSRAQRIADAGRAMVQKNHSVNARARQFKSIFESVIDGSFSGGAWERGTFKINLNQN